MKLILVVFVLFVTHVQSFAQEEIITMIQGKWKIDTDKFEAYEEWKLKDNTEIVGTSYSIKNGEMNKSEDLFIKKIGNYWGYIAIPKNQMPALFILKSSVNNKYVFENPEHDFPQRIIYEFVQEKRISVIVEGVEKGKPKKLNFSFIKID